MKALLIFILLIVAVFALTVGIPALLVYDPSCKMFIEGSFIARIGTC